LMALGGTYHYVGLSCAVGCSVTQLLCQLHNDVCELLKLTGRPKPIDAPLPTAIGHLASIATSTTGGALARIHIDELPLDDESDIRLFVRAFCGALLAQRTANGGGGIYYYVTTVCSPTLHIASTQQSVTERLRTVNLGPWSSAELADLIHLVSKHLRVPPDASEIELIVLAARGSPRFVKACLRLRLTHPSWAFGRIVQEVPRYR
jgi:hypothetical protein